MRLRNPRARRAPKVCGNNGIYFGSKGKNDHSPSPSDDDGEATVILTSSSVRNRAHANFTVDTQHPPPSSAILAAVKRQFTTRKNYLSPTDTPARRTGNMANIKRVRSHTKRSSAREAPKKKRAQAERGHHVETSHISSDIPKPQPKKSTKTDKALTASELCHAAFPTLEPGPTVTQRPPDRHDILRLVEERHRGGPSDTRIHQYALMEEKMGTHFGDERISFRDLYPSIRQTIIDEICEGTTGVYKSDYIPTLQLLRIDQQTLSAILKENSQLWNQDHPIPPHLVRLKLAFPDRVIDPDTPPTYEIIKATKFLKQERLPRSLLGEWQFSPMLEELIVPEPQSTSVTTAVDNVNAKAKSKLVRDLDQETGRSLPVQPAEPKRPTVSPITPVQTPLGTSKNHKKQTGIDYESHQRLREQSLPPKHSLRDIKREDTAAHSQKSITIASSGLDNSSTCFKPKKEGARKSKNVENSVQSSESGEYRSNGQRQLSSPMLFPPRDTFPPPGIPAKQGMENFSGETGVSEVTMADVMRKHYQLLNPERTLAPDKHHSLPQKGTLDSPRPMSPMYTQRHPYQSFHKRQAPLGVQHTSPPETTSFTGLQSPPRLSQAPHGRSVAGQEPHLDASKCPHIPPSHVQHKSPGNLQPQYSLQRQRGQFLHNSTQERDALLQMELQKRSFPTGGPSSQQSGQHYLQSVQQVSLDRALSQQYQLHQNQTPKMQSPPVHQMGRPSQFNSRPLQGQIQISPTSTVRCIPQQGSPSSSSAQDLSNLSLLLPNINLFQRSQSQASSFNAPPISGQQLPPSSNVPLATATAPLLRSQLSPTGPFAHSRGLVSSATGGTHGSAYNTINLMEPRQHPRSPQQFQSTYGDLPAYSAASPPHFVKTGFRNSVSPSLHHQGSIYPSSPGRLPDLHIPRQQPAGAPQVESSRVARLIDPRLPPSLQETQTRNERASGSSECTMNPNATQNLVKVGSVQEIKDLETPKKRKRDVGLVYIGSEIIDDEGDDDMKRVRP